ncbi:hypothetical protein IGI04_040114 [Brassica rapa subsp. trilocularis]|uniref:Uncharacterized protein n=1 Tax=Brassica rapa subsp. trilocularis TaxID=1813537 RepID=A0ABQ7KLW1_BRACM|nr:hypothetical protein IGI04_040114 [Brassica rapa subsp. trilocularis]
MDYFREMINSTEGQKRKGQTNIGGSCDSTSISGDDQNNQQTRDGTDAGENVDNTPSVNISAVNADGNTAALEEFKKMFTAFTKNLKERDKIIGVTPPINTNAPIVYNSRLFNPKKQYLIVSSSGQGLISYGTRT